MSYEVIFSFSISVAKPMRVPAGTMARIESQIRATESALGFKREKYRNNPERWVTHTVGDDIDDKIACHAVSEHNRFSFWLWRRIHEWSKQHPDGKTEVLTVKKSAALFPFLGQIDLSPERWTADFYQERMDEVYEVMRGRPTNGIIFDAKALTPAQADAIITLFSGCLDIHDVRLAVPKGHDSLARSDDGGYQWCDKCFCAIAESDIGCCGKKKCPLADDEDGSDR
jgi:hypothetical protein